jgi:hypothetical protein
MKLFVELVTGGRGEAGIFTDRYLVFSVFCSDSTILDEVLWLPNLKSSLFHEDLAVYCHLMVEQLAEQVLRTWPHLAGQTRGQHTLSQGTFKPRNVS